jgi:hypothetical protein
MFWHRYSLIRGMIVWVCSVLSQLHGALWASFSASLWGTQETSENINWGYDNLEPVAESGIRNWIVLQLLVQPKFSRSNRKWSVITYIIIVTVSEYLKIWPLASFSDSKLWEFNIIRFYGLFQFRIIVWNCDILFDSMDRGVTKQKSEHSSDYMVAMLGSYPMLRCHMITYWLLLTVCSSWSGVFQWCHVCCATEAKAVHWLHFVW